MKHYQEDQEEITGNYYVALLNEDGSIKHTDPTKIFKVEMGAQVRFRLPRGCQVSRDVTLLVNKPRKIIGREKLGEEEEEEEQKGQIDSATTEYIKEYTVTQPRQRVLKKKPQKWQLESSLIQCPPKMADIMSQQVDDDEETDEEDSRTTYKGSYLEPWYLERVEQHQRGETVNIEFRVQFPEAGSFFVQLEYFDLQLNGYNFTDPIYINVEPHLLLRGSKLSVKELSILTVLPRCLGPMEERWDRMFDNISQLGYNAVHFAPIQKYGVSRSHYSLADQTLIDDYFFQNEGSQNVITLSREERYQQLKWKIDYLKNEYGVLGIIDIVLNHTACNSEWLLEHPEAAYNTKDCPHLNSAFVLDQALSDFSDDFARKKIPECPSAPYISNEGDLRAVMNSIYRRVIDKLNMPEFFYINKDQILGDLRGCIQTLTEAQLEKYHSRFEHLLTKDHYTVFNDQFVVNRGSERMQTTCKFRQTAAYFYLANGRNQDRAVQEVGTIINRHNEDWRGRVGQFMKEAMNAIEGTIRYFKIEQRKSQVTADNKLVNRYFRVLDNQEQSKVAHNGWIMNANPMEDFGMQGWHYLRRTINAWDDSIKLRYGNCPADSPFLWDHMAQYVHRMALIFDGFRLDNAHSTPIHVCYYLLQIARSVNPNLFVMAELFTSSAQADAHFVRKLNINGLIREMQNSYDAKSLGDYFHQITCTEKVIGLLDEEFEDLQTGQKYKILKAKRPNDILYDCTHDNPPPVEKFKTGRIALSHIGVQCMADISIASTWGYDQLMNYHIDLINEKRHYAILDQKNLFDPDEVNPESRRLSYQMRQLSASLDQQRHFIPDAYHPEHTPEILSPPEQTEFEYEFVFIGSWPKSVKLAGTFTGWQQSLELKKSGNDIWTLKVPLPIVEGEERHMFKFVADGQWLMNDSLPKVGDGKGNVNNYLDVPRPKSKQSTITTTQPQSQQEFTFQDIRYARRKFNEVHEECTRFNAEIFLHQQTQDVLVIIRQFPLDYHPLYDGYVSITRHCYYQEGGDYNYNTVIELPGLFQEVIFAGYLEIDPSRDYKNIDQSGDPKVISHANAKLRVFKGLNQFCRVERTADQKKDKLVFFKMPPSFTCIVKTRSHQKMKEAVRFLNAIDENMRSEQLCEQLLREATLPVLNHLLFRCENEEKDISKGERGPYGLQNYGAFKYAGISSFMKIVKELKVSGDMGHELLKNLREGDWYLDYAKNRLKYFEYDLRGAIKYLEECTNHVKELEQSIRPKYAARVIEKLYNAAVYAVTHLRMVDPFIQGHSGDPFVQHLALAALQFYAKVPSSIYKEHQNTLAAGLPHFSTVYMRCWGRDTFISLKGLLLSTNVWWEEAKQIIIQFAKVMRHGLIPNLHDQGNNTRFNARDATWFFLQAIKDLFLEMIRADQGDLYMFLKKTVIELHFRDDDQQRHEEKLRRGEPPRKVLLIDLIQEILQAHARGIKFREWNAGTKIDQQMQSQGFNVEITLDTETGFIHGGNQFNCGTWMDKMGSSDKTGNKGIPATPRDGAPIELVALQYSFLSFMEELASQGFISHTGVFVRHQGQEVFWTYGQWAKRMRDNFERCFWIPQSPAEDQAYSINNQLVNRRGIYKDVLRPTHAYTEYQLRPNVCVAMSYASELFRPDHALTCLRNVEAILMEPGCMGIKTLDPSDKNYRGDYVNSDDSHGWNYHQGPEWLWPVGNFLKAKINFNSQLNKEGLKEEIMRFLLPHQKHIIEDSRWEGLPELTNSHGKECQDSCPTQAWSIATILDAVREVNCTGLFY